ncbi:MAG: hypothetical protein AAF570_00040 [Bacteroidota bacterium]
MPLKKSHITLLISLLLVFAQGKGQDVNVNAAYSSEFEQETFEAWARGDSVSVLRLLMAAEPGMTTEKYAEMTQQLDGIFADVEKTLPPKGEHRRVDKIFRSIRKAHFADFSPVASVVEVLEMGRFNCVSATAVLAMAFDYFEVPFQIQEQPRHVFLYALTGDRPIRVETTSRDFGVIRAGKREAQQFEQQFATMGKTRRSAQGAAHIAPDQLAGLHFYNEGLQAMDQADYLQAWRHFDRAWMLYPCTRVEEMRYDAASHLIDQGTAALLSGDLSTASTDLDLAYQVRPQDAQLQTSLLALTLKRAEDAASPADGIQSLKSATQRYPFLSEDPLIRGLQADLAAAVSASPAH